MFFEITISNAKESGGMSYAFSEVLRTQWNDEVIEYLVSKFNSSTPRIVVLCKSVFLNSTLVKFDGVSFVINAANECLELSFAKVDADKMEPVIQEILRWKAFTQYASRFCVRVDKNTSYSIVFNSGISLTTKELKDKIHNYKMEILLVVSDKKQAMPKLPPLLERRKALLGQKSYATDPRGVKCRRLVRNDICAIYFFGQKITREEIGQYEWK